MYQPDQFKSRKDGVRLDRVEFLVVANGRIMRRLRHTDQVISLCCGRWLMFAGRAGRKLLAIYDSRWDLERYVLLANRGLSDGCCLGHDSSSHGLRAVRLNHVRCVPRGGVRRNRSVVLVVAVQTPVWHLVLLIVKIVFKHVLAIWARLICLLYFLQITRFLLK